MKTFTFVEAAAFLKMQPEGLRRKIARGEIPAAKVGNYLLDIHGTLQTDLTPLSLTRGLPKLRVY